MRINTKKSCCLRVNPIRFNLPCARITTSDGNSLLWVSETRYLGTYIVAGRELRCLVTHAKRSFHRAMNAIFEKVERLASEEVTLQLAKRKMYTNPNLWIRMFCIMKSRCEIS